MGVTRIVDTDDTGNMTSGTIRNNAWLQSIYDSLLVNATTDAWTPVWTGSGSNPVIGNGTIVGRKFVSSKVVHFTATITVGSSTTFGTGNYSISLPETATGGGAGLINIWIADASAGGAIFNAKGYIATTTTFAVMLTTEAAGSAASPMTPTAPITLANGDVIYATGFFFKA